MSMKALSQIMDQVQSIKPKAIAATTTGTTVDLANVIGNMFIVEPGAWTDGTHTVSLLESSDDSTYTAVAAGDLVNNIAFIPMTSAPTAVIQSVSYIGKLRYVRALWTTGTATTGMVGGVSAILHYRKQP